MGNVANAPAGDEAPSDSKASAPKDNEQTTPPDPEESKGPSQATLDRFSKQLENLGPRKLKKSRRSSENQISRHESKTEDARRVGGYNSSMEKEFQNFRDSIEAIDRALKGGGHK